MDINVPDTIERCRRIEEKARHIREKLELEVAMVTGCLNPKLGVGELDTTHGYFDFADIHEMAGDFCRKSNERYRKANR